MVRSFYLKILSLKDYFTAMMTNIYPYHKGQSAVELALFIGIIMFILATMFTYGQRFEAQNLVKMEAFRNALAQAYKLNAPVSYTIKKDLRFMNLPGNFREGQGSSVGATASVMWVKGMPGAQNATNEGSYSFYKINDVILGNETGLPRFTKKVYDRSGSKEIDSTLPVTVGREEMVKYTDYRPVASGSTMDRVEEETSITTRQTAELRENVTYRIFAYQDMTKNNPTAPRPEIQNKTPEIIFADPTFGIRPNATTGEIEYLSNTTGGIRYERRWETPD